METPRILVLAGRRSATLDPLAAVMGVSHKALVPVAGEAMVGRVLRIAAEAFPQSPLFVSVEDFRDHRRRTDRRPPPRRGPADSARSRASYRRQRRRGEPDHRLPAHPV